MQQMVLWLVFPQPVKPALFLLVCSTTKQAAEKGPEFEQTLK
jgi:hypothetical protein